LRAMKATYITTNEISRVLGSMGIYIIDLRDHWVFPKTAWKQECKLSFSKS